MQLTDLRTFLAIADSASFSQAAELLHVTQPAVSKRMQALEQGLGVQLFDRVGKRVHLTQAGELLVPQARQMLAMAADTERQMKSLSDAITGTLHLATSHHIGLHRLAPVLREFTARYPEVQLNIQFEDSEVAHEMVRQGDIELAVVTLNPEGDALLTCSPTWHDPLRFVAADPSSESFTLERLARMPCVLPGVGTYTGRIVLERFSERSLDLAPSMSTNYLETIGMLVSVGLGWSVLPESMIDNLATLDVDCADMSRTLGCVTNPQRSRSNAGTAFLEVVAAFAD